jgi:phosphatidylglycerophosphate synthase
VPRWTGKLATVLQMTVVLWALFKWDTQWLRSWCLLAGAFTALSGIQYMFDGVRQLSAHPSSSPSALQPPKL